MTHHHKAHGLASLGRHGDTMLVHMSPEEVQGLESIARMQGTRLTRNPDTGMPEAFSLGGFFKSLLPTVAGLGISAMFPGASPWLIGTLAGVGTTLATGNPLAGIMTGLGVGGGMGIGKGVFNIGENLASNAGSEVAESVGANELAKQGAAYTAGQGVSPFVNNPTMVAQQASTAAALPNYTAELGMANNPAFNTATMQAPTSAVIGQNVNTFTKGLGESFSNPGALVKELGGGTNAAIKLGTPVVGALANGIEPKDYLGYDPNASQPEQKKIDINKPLNLNYDTGLKLYATGGTISTGGNFNTYNTLDDQAIKQANLSQDGFGLGRLNSLVGAQEMNQAKTFGYAEGGETHLNLDQLPTLNLNTGISSLPANVAPANMDDNQFRSIMYRMNALGGNGPSGKSIYDQFQPQLKFRLLGMAKGGYLDGQGDGMSDSIPATIEGKQPARLADGEFVVPADVVSHIGNGSSKAGSQRLYSMLDKVRKARTGNKKQGKQINPNQYLPA
jgi:hypothetical protein